MFIIVSNLSRTTTARQLSDLFNPFGAIKSARIIHSETTGCSLGLGYIEMEQQSGLAAINELHNKRYMNYYIEVTDAGV